MVVTRVPGDLVQWRISYWISFAKSQELVHLISLVSLADRTMDGIGFVSGRWSGEAGHGINR